MSDTAIHLSFGKIEAGWVHAKLTVGARTHEITGFSDTYDSFGDMARFGLDAALDALVGTARFDGEPVETRWMFDNGGGELVRFRVLTFDSFTADRSPDQGQEELSSWVPRDQLAEAILVAFDDLSEKRSSDLAIGWPNYPFPTRSVTALRAALSVQRYN